MEQFIVDYNVNLIKADESENRLRIKIEASSPIPDKEDDMILLSCFDDETVKDFLSSGGLIDWKHLTVRGKTEYDKAIARIGSADKFYIKSNKPIAEATLFKTNPFVRDCIKPALDEGAFKLFGASIGGGILQKSTVFDTQYRKKLNKISKIKLNHIAIDDANKVINPETSISVIKSFNDEEIISFTGFETFSKALTVGYATDLNQRTGGNALITINNEDDIIRLFGNALDFIAMNYDTITMENLRQWLQSQGLDIEQAYRFAEFLVEKAENIKKLIGVK